MPWIEEIRGKSSKPRSCFDNELYDCINATWASSPVPYDGKLDLWMSVGKWRTQSTSVPVIKMSLSSAFRCLKTINIQISMIYTDKIDYQVWKYIMYTKDM